MSKRLGFCLAVVCVVFSAFAASGKAKTRIHTADVGARAAKLARKFVGVRYRWGGTSRAGFDCSGLVYFVYGKLGVTLPRTSYDQLRTGRRVRPGKLRPGDLIFFHGGGHVGMYIGKGRFIHANQTGGSVRVRQLAGWYRSAMLGARRVAAPPSRPRPARA